MFLIEIFSTVIIFKFFHNFGLDLDPDQQSVGPDPNSAKCPDPDEDKVSKSGPNLKHWFFIGFVSWNGWFFEPINFETLNNSEIFSENHLKFQFRLFLALKFSMIDFLQYTFIAGFRNNFQDHRRPSERWNNLPQEGYWKYFHNY